MTERTALRQSMVDDDAISLTSTAVSEYDSDAEFSVDRILAERTESGKKRYLIRWENYPLEKATWEPHKNINDEILEVWKERKSQESKGLEQPFDVAGFYALLARLAAEKADRRRRRKAKRKRLGRIVSPSASEADDSDSSIEAIEENEVEDVADVKPGSKRKSKSPSKKPAKALKTANGRRESTSSLASIDAARREPVKKASAMSKTLSNRSRTSSRQASEASRHSRTLSHSSSDTPLSQQRLLQQSSVERPSSSSSEGPSALKSTKTSTAMPKPPATASKPLAANSTHTTTTSKPPTAATKPHVSKPTSTTPATPNVWKLTAARKTASSSEPSELPPIRGASSSSRGRVATRGGGNIAHKNVFQAREPPKKRGTLLKNAMDPEKAPKKFSNMRLHRKAELQARDLAEGAPDINALGGLFDPSRPDSMVPIRPENLRKTSSNMVPLDNDPNPLFVNSRESSPVANDLRRTANNQPQPAEQVSSAYRGISTCYYWDKQQRGTDQPPCQMGTACRFLHRYAAGVPIAPPPVTVSADTKSAVPTCFFWDRGMKFGKASGCGKGDTCSYQHRYEEGLPIAPPPAGWVEIAPKPSSGDSWRPSTAVVDDPVPHDHPRAPDAEREPAGGSSGSTCFFWDRAKKDSNQPDCLRGDACTYYHGYAEGVPIAPPPQGYVEKSNKSEQHAEVHPHPRTNERKLPRLESATCYYWDRAQRSSKFPTCSRGDSCAYHHGYEVGLPIAPPPNPIAKSSDSLRDPSTEDFAPWPADSSENRPQTTVSLPSWQSGSGDKSVAEPQQDVFRPTSDLSTLLLNLRTTTGSPLNPASAPHPAPLLRDTIIPNEEAPTRPAWDAYNPTRAVCHFFFTNGSCSKDFRCNYVHNLAMSLPVAPSIREQAKIFSRTPCLDFQKGYCRYTATGDCRLLHIVQPPRNKHKVGEEQSDAPLQEVRSSRPIPRQGSGSIEKPASDLRVTTTTSSSIRGPATEFDHIISSSSPKSQTRPEWNPFDPFKSICYFWYTNGDCIKGRSCNFTHRDDPELPIAPAPQDQASMRERAAKKMERSISAREKADCYRPSKVASSDIPSRDEASERKAGEIDKDQANQIRETSSSSRHPLSPRVNPAPVGKSKADAEPQKIDASSKDSARSPLHSTSSTPTRTKPRPAWNPRDPLNSICFFWATTGSCPEERDCQYIHNEDSDVAIAPSPLDMKERPAWDARNPLHAICYFLASTGSCKSGSRCKFFHSNDPTLPVAPSPFLNEMMGPPEHDDRGRPTCRYWLRDDCTYNDSTCRFWHGPVSAKQQYALAVKGLARPQPGSPTKPTPTGQRVKSVSFAVDETMPIFEEPVSMWSPNQRNEAPRPQVSPIGSVSKTTCNFWMKGDCWRGNECNFRHAYPDGERTTRHVEDVPRTDNGEKRVQTEPQRRKASRDVEMQDRVERQPMQIPVRPYESSKDVEMQEAAEKQPAQATKNIEMKDAAASLRPSVARKPSVRFAMSENELPTATEASKPVPHPGIIRLSEFSAELPIPSSGSQILATNAKPKMKIDDYRREKALKDLGNRAKEVTFGLDETQSLVLDFGDMSQALGLPWGSSFCDITKIRFDQMCIAQDFQAQQGLLQRLKLWHGNILPIKAGDSETINAINKAADELIRRSAGLFSTFQDFLVLIFPAKRVEWKFLESTLDYSQDVRLRYFVFQSNIDIRQSFKIEATSLNIGASYRDVLVEKIHGLDIKRLLPVFKKSKPKPPNVYLLFPSTAAPTANFIISWLRSSNRNCKIYTSQTEGSWQYFTRTPEIDQGTILVHESAAAELHRLPNLYSMAAEKNFSFWYISESNSPYPLFPSTSYHFDDSTMGQLSAVRLFPHGCAFLITPSFLVAEPHAALQILNWFILGSKTPKYQPPKYLASTPRTWKLVCCHNLSDYILEIANSKAAEKDALELKHRDNPAKDAILHEAGLSFSECSIRYKLHRVLVEFDSKRNLESYSEYESDDDESDYPFIHANKHIDPDDEKGLIEWFAGWTMRNLDMYKKFVIVGSSEPKYRGRLTRMKEQEVMKKGPISATESPKPPIANFRAFSLSKQASASPMESPQSPMSAQKQKALAVAARLSNTPPRKNIDRTRDIERTDDLAVKGALSPSLRNGQKSRLSSVQSPQEIHSTGLGINLDKQISELIAESKGQLPRFDNVNAGSLSNGSSNRTPRSGSSNPANDQRSPPQLDGADDQSVDMELDSPMLDFDGAGDERPTSSSSSRSEIQSDETGRRFVPRSIRPDTSVRKEIAVRPGYIPLEDGDFYQIPSRRASAAGTPSGQSAAEMESAMDVDIESENERARKKMPRWRTAESVEDGEIEEVRKELKEVRFESTLSWYKRELKEGRGWEHIRVEGFEAAAKTLGVGK